VNCHHREVNFPEVHSAPVHRDSLIGSARQARPVIHRLTG